MTEITAPELPPVQRFEPAGGPAIAYRYFDGTGPTLVFLPGYMSDMDGGKATATMADAIARGQSCLLLDYSGCGQSAGEFADGTLSGWRDEVVMLLDHIGAGTVQRPVVLIGSSMGGWLMLMIGQAVVLRAGAAALHAIVGIAAAPDFTEWGHSAEQTATLERGEIWFEENIYGPEPTPYHPAFHAGARRNLLLDREIALTCPVRLLQGQRDPDVPWQTALRLSEVLESEDVQVTLIKSGDHRLSRDEDIALLLNTVREVSA